MTRKKLLRRIKTTTVKGEGIRNPLRLLQVCNLDWRGTSMPDWIRIFLLGYLVGWFPLLCCHDIGLHFGCIVGQTYFLDFLARVNRRLVRERQK